MAKYALKEITKKKSEHFFWGQTPARNRAPWKEINNSTTPIWMSRKEVYDTMSHLMFCSESRTVKLEVVSSKQYKGAWGPETQNF